ncbi:hypothetical protein P3S68_001777 [Capsicum galapagoense]
MVLLWKICSVVVDLEQKEIHTFLMDAKYTARFNAETVKNFLYTLNDGKIA